MFRTLPLFITVLCIACGGSSPTSPGPIVTPPPVSTWTLTGQIVHAVNAQAISGARLLGVTSDQSGLFRVESTGTRTSQRATVEAEGYLTRVTSISAATENPIIDLIPQSATLYQQLAHNAFEGGSEPIRRWTSAPQFYITQDGSLTPEDIRRVTVGILAATNQMSPFGNVGITVGPAREERAGWVTVAFPSGAPGFCGQSRIGGNPGLIEFPLGANCTTRCSGGRIIPGTVAHEVGHALGLWHSDSGTMKAGSDLSYQCGDPSFTPAEREAARLVYKRPLGNLAPDTDPMGMAFLGQPRTITD